MAGALSGTSRASLRARTSPTLRIFSQIGLIRRANTKQDLIRIHYSKILPIAILVAVLLLKEESKKHNMSRFMSQSCREYKAVSNKILIRRSALQLTIEEDGGQLTLTSPNRAL
jgi:K+-transporting ATPase A subunit